MEGKEFPLIPAEGRVIVIPYEEESTGGFVMPDSQKAKDAQVKGQVMAFNPSPYISEYGAKVALPEGITEGVIIVHRAWGHDEVTWQNKKYRIVKHVDISAIIKI